MNLIEIFMIAVGLSVDVYAVVVCQGAVLLKIEKTKLLKMSLIFCIWQVMALLVGNGITRIPFLAVSAENMRDVWELISVIIFMALGVYMLYKAWKNEEILERLGDIHYGRLCIAAFLTSGDAFFAGMGFGFLHTKLAEVAICILIVTVLAVVSGLYTGYRLGYEQKTKAYGIGGILLIVSALDVVFRYFLR